MGKNTLASDEHLLAGERGELPIKARIGKEETSEKNRSLGEKRPDEPGLC